MFDDKNLSRHQHLTTSDNPGGVAPSRLALQQRTYLKERRDRLDAEQVERQRSDLEAMTENADTGIRRLWSAARQLIVSANPRRRAHG